ncbi:MAG: tRNA dihydrouridine synthase DusB [Clostridia bacterium]|nr:tRNA dihydrouridine synthase DusB [Clostridia bacterium]
MKLGNIELCHGVMLAPMAGVTDRSFRRLCHECGSEYSVSEMVSAKALCYEQQGKRRESSVMGSAPLASVTRAEGPMAVQIFGKEPSFMAEAAKMIEASSYRGCTSEVAPVAIDINMGCPMRKITGNGEGSALMKTPKLAGEICEAVVRAVSLPVTVKIRAGWDSESVNAAEVARILEASGASMICVHARTREQLYSPGIELGVIEAVKRAVKIPVVGNGDISSADDAVNMINRTGCDGVMIGRGAMGNPWIFSEIAARLEGRRFDRPSVSERIDTAVSQLESVIAHKGERVGLAEGKKHMAWYLSGIRGAASARNAIMTAHTKDEIYGILSEIKNENADGEGTE